jgi:hypothetical protein
VLMVDQRHPALVPSTPSSFSILRRVRPRTISAVPTNWESEAQNIMLRMSSLRAGPLAGRWRPAEAEAAAKRDAN